MNREMIDEERHKSNETDLVFVIISSMEGMTFSKKVFSCEKLGSARIKFTCMTLLTCSCVCAQALSLSLIHVRVEYCSKWKDEHLIRMKKFSVTMYYIQQFCYIILEAKE